MAAKKKIATWRVMKGKSGIYERFDAATGKPWPRRNGKRAIRLVTYRRASDGSLKQAVEHFDSITAAEDRKAEKRHNVNRGMRESVSAASITVSDLYERLPAWRKAKGMKPYGTKTAIVRDGSWKHVPQWFRDTKIKDVDPSAVNTICGDIEGDEARRKTRGLLSVMFKMAVDERYLTFNPAEGGHFTAPAPDHRVLETVELKRLIAAMPERYHCLVEVMGRVGLRPSEAYELTVGRVGVRSLSIVKTKTGKPRVIPIAEDLAGKIAAHIERFSDPHDPTALVFMTSNDAAINDRNFRRRAFRPAAIEAGIDPTDAERAKMTDPPRRLKPYDLRHTACSNALRRGIDPATVANMSGHSVKVLLSTYSHYFQSAGEAAADHLGAIWQSEPEPESGKVLEFGR